LASQWDLDQIRNTAVFLANLRFADWDTKEICGFVICALFVKKKLQICNFWTGTAKKFLRLRNEPKNLRTNKKENLRPHPLENNKKYTTINEIYIPGTEGRWL
jgi:hypothetical protein